MTHLQLPDRALLELVHADVQVLRGPGGADNDAPTVRNDQAVLVTRIVDERDILRNVALLTNVRKEREGS